MRELSIRDLSELTGLAKETVGIRLRARGVSPARADGRAHWFDPSVALPALLRGGTAEAERARLDGARADLYEHELAKRRSETIPRGDHQRAVIALATAVAARLEPVPALLAAEVAAAPDPAVCQEIVARYIREARDDLAVAGVEAVQALARREK